MRKICNTSAFFLNIKLSITYKNSVPAFCLLQKTRGNIILLNKCNIYLTQNNTNVTLLKCSFPINSCAIWVPAVFVICLSCKLTTFHWAAITFIVALADPTLSPLLLSSAPSIFDNKRQDPTGLTALLRSTDLVGVVHTLYCILLHSFSPESSSQSQEPYGPGVIQVALQGIRFLNNFALLDLSAFQVFSQIYYLF